MKLKFKKNKNKNKKFLIMAVISSFIVLNISGCSNTNDTNQENNANSNDDIDTSSELPPIELPPVGEDTGGHNPDGLPDNSPVTGGGSGKDMPASELPPDNPDGLPPTELPPIGEDTGGHNPDGPDGLGTNGAMPERPMARDPEKP